MQITVTVNDVVFTREVEPRLLLIHFLRDELGLTGSHWGCDTSNCGACVVWMDELPVKSCTVLAAMADGRRVLTVEGLERNGRLDPVQQGFAHCHGLQCGFCTPGMMLTARWLLDHHPDPTPAQIREALSGQVCRCTGYENIVRSVQWAAQHRWRRRSRRPSFGARGGRMNAEQNGAYGPVPRKEDARFIRGRGMFVDDIKLPGMLYGAILRSPLPHARITAIDTVAAEGHPRVEAVFTGQDLAALGLAWMPTISQDAQAVLATDKVRFQGQEVAFVVAQDRYSARDALELIHVEYEPLPVVADAERALDPGAPVIRDDLPGKADNHIFDWEAGDKAATDAVFAAADVVVSQDMLYPRSHPAPLETCGMVADMDPVSGRLTLWSTSQAPHAHRTIYALVAGLARAQDPGGLPRHRRWFRQQGTDLSRLHLRHRRLHEDRQAGQVGRGPVGKPDVHHVRPRLPHARGDRRHRRRQGAGAAGHGARRPRRLQRDRPADQVPGRVLPHLHRLLRPAGRALRR